MPVAPRILIVKLSSLGDVVHAMAAALPQARIDWLVERAFAPLVARCEGVAEVIACDLRRWRKRPLARQTRLEWRAFRARLQRDAYDAVIDLQGLTKSALVARLARLAPGGLRYGLGNATAGSSYEAPARWLVDRPIRLEPQVHVVQRSRLLCAAALAYSVEAPARFGLQAHAASTSSTATAAAPLVALVHATSRADKEWPEENWIGLAARLAAAGYTVALPHGSEAERLRSVRLAAQMERALVWPAMPLDALSDALAGCAGVVGVDSGLSHIAVALDLPHVQIYNFDTAWRTGADTHRQCSVYAQPAPSLDAVWQAWCTVARNSGLP
jgi:heptosyltransferase I